MRALIVSGAPSGASLTARLADDAVATLRTEDHDVDVVRLVEVGWNPVPGPGDYGIEAFTGPLGDAAEEALLAGTLSPEVLRQQALLGAADLLVLVYPLWWYGMPAVLKGWVDRVFTQGFAYGLHDEDGQPRKFGDGAFAGKRGLVVTAAGDRESAFTPRGVTGGIDDLLFPVTHGLFWYTGIAPLRPLTLLGVYTPLWEGFDAARSRLRERLAGVWDEDPLAFRWLLEDYDGARVLRADLAPGREGFGAHLR